MIVGIDFDNTIVNYDSVFHKVAREQKLIPPEIATNKTAVRDYLRAQRREDAWTEMQGYVYGKRMGDATIFPGVLDCLESLLHRNVTFYVISHKTKYPYKGPTYDLHASATEWLSQFLFEPLGLSVHLGENAFFNPSKAAKIECISSMKCTHFVDDLPELFGDGHFPEAVCSIFFDPGNSTDRYCADQRFSSWSDISEFLCGE